MSEDIKIGTNRNFGIVFFIVFLLIAIYPIFNEDKIKIWALIISVIFLVLGIINSNFLSPLNKTWFKFGLFLGKIISPLVMCLIFFLIVTPIGLLMRILKKDILNLKFSKKKSYWINKNNLKCRMDKQF